MTTPLDEPTTVDLAGENPSRMASQGGRGMNATVYDLLSAQARQHPNAPAILAPGRAPLDFGGLLDQIDYVRRFLNGRGLGCGDRVALLGGRGSETAVVTLGIESGATCVPLNATAPLTELQRALVETRARALMV